MTLAAERFDDPAMHDEPAPSADPSDRIEELAAEARIMLARDVALARAELALATRHAVGAGRGFGAAVLVGYLALALVAVAAGLGLSAVLPAWLAFLAVGLALGLVAGLAYAAGRRNFQALSPVPHHTIENIKEDVSWLRERMT